MMLVDTDAVAERGAAALTFDGSTPAFVDSNSKSSSCVQAA